LAIANRNPVTSIFLGNGDGTFQPPATVPVSATSGAAADFNGDGRLDLAYSSFAFSGVSVLLGLGDGRTFVPPGTISNAIRATPLVADLTGDGVADLTVLNRKGEILLRRGRPGAP